MLSNNNNDVNTSLRPREIENFYSKLSSMRSSNKYISRSDAQWMQTFVTAHLDTKRAQYKSE